jgi:hypothetical protein
LTAFLPSCVIAVWAVVASTVPSMSSRRRNRNVFPLSGGGRLASVTGAQGRVIGGGGGGGGGGGLFGGGGGGAQGSAPSRRRWRVRVHADGTGMTNGAGAENVGNGIVDLSWTVDPGCAPEPPPPPPGPEAGQEAGGVAVAVVAVARFTG